MEKQTRLHRVAAQVSSIQCLFTRYRVALSLDMLNVSLLVAIFAIRVLSLVSIVRNRFR